ncbi:long-chain fatty acid--CoA ligase [Sphingomonas sp. BIUV-7]|uniref:Long-chain fatty acid--CoA ligase n=1 Tax=Sphingomonas natans TaxID=3063330 RepID=A0ABT8Y963_9SPHN|nr:long-chain fatty acid--CoA ligase [Sphingomonas sp. BIUV-7]MDO6414865.1 long-chain fatty acid--CoA ligase [Sphingomonas sp. BIUV-7]
MQVSVVPPSTEGTAGEAPLLRPRLLTDLLDATVARHPDWTAIDFLGRTWSYGEIGALVERAARGLQDQGLKPGDRFGLCLPNSPYFVILYFAVLRIGGIVVNFNPLYVERELEHQIKDSGTRMMAVPDLVQIHGKVLNVAETSKLDRIIVCPMTGILPWALGLGFRFLKRKDHAQVPDDARHVAWVDLIASDRAHTPVARNPDDIAVLQYTGGTTGVPKGAMLTHANLAANSAQMVVHVGDHPDVQERTLGVLPMFHVFALTTVLNYSVDSGAEMILLPRFDLKQMLKTIARTHPTQFFGVPTIYVAINGADEAALAGFKSIRCCISGGAPLPFEVREAFERRTGVMVVEGYGLSEASPILACNPLQGPVKDNSTGPAFPDTVIEIRDLDDPHRVLAQGERGEVCARGPQVMKGYWRNETATDAVFVDGALRTGDVGYVDEDGYLFLVDRIKDVILCSGFNVYPRVIEDAAYQHPAVKEAIAIGVPDTYRGQAPKLFLVFRDGMSATKEELSDFLHDRINKIEMPKEIEIRTSLPKTLIGKLSRKDLVAEEAAKAKPS